MYPSIILLLGLFVVYITIPFYPKSKWQMTAMALCLAYLGFRVVYEIAWRYSYPPESVPIRWDMLLFRWLDVYVAVLLIVKAALRAVGRFREIGRSSAIGIQVAAWVILTLLQAFYFGEV